ncbi:PAS domain-containing sensor histidine kinase [Chryseobacterium sp. Leaf180]|uniref:sensor histidine kinase n=1 Tax=Chryseobacterium sp. Leaf180 TaxID=1736289 RepID=UPI0007019298|nr:ATP-binding protein [Chryseobacterium sp. Leaf180]KQR94473.1 PAS domain-containing sensor histidine kinase [Chryseobacterium sp. Leaf180]
MKIKTKLNAGVGLLFLMIIILSALGGWFIFQLKKDTQNILVANYNTLQYSRNMLLAVEDLQTSPRASELFRKNLKLQKDNITEDGEREATERVSEQFKLLLENPENVNIQSTIRKEIAEIMQLNMAAIRTKSGVANLTAQNAIAFISIAGTVCFLIAFIVMLNLPSNIADPIRKLTMSIRQIANQNYQERVQFEGNSEFGELARSFNTMAEKLQEYSESRLDKILKGKKRIETLIDNMHDAVIGIDENRKVLFVNDEALRITGLKRENFVGKLIQDVAVTNDLVRKIITEIIAPQDLKNKQDVLKIFVAGKENYFEQEIVDINVVPTGEKESNLIGQVIMLRNITPFKELDLAKTRFLGTVSHEFKTPISSVKMGLQLLENKKVGQLNIEQSRLVAGIREDIDRLLKITGELLNITQLESGLVQLQIHPAKIETIVDSAVTANLTKAQAKNIEIKISIDEGLPEILADEDKTVWVLNNLINNAVKFSRENSEVSVSVFKNERDEAVFRIEDNGSGIGKKYREKIFERYFRVPDTLAEGTGLGLSISKELIESQNGKIWLEDSEDGAVFCFTIPLMT